MTKPSLTHPHTLTTCSISELLEVTQAVNPWTETLARQLDCALRSRVVNVFLSHEADDEELAELQKAIKIAVPHRVRPSLDGLSQPWIARWLSWADLLDTRRAQLQSPKIRRARDHNK